MQGKHRRADHGSLRTPGNSGNNVIEANYVGTSGSGLPANYNLNAPFAGPVSVAWRRPTPALGDTTFQSAMDSFSYNALEVRFERRYASGLGLLSSYTFSKTLDYGGEQLIGDLSLRDAPNVKAERGLSAGDIRHRWVYQRALRFARRKKQAPEHQQSDSFGCRRRLATKPDFYRPRGAAVHAIFKKETSVAF